MARLQGKCAVITGAAGGIGRAIAIAFVREGAQVGLNYMLDKDYPVIEKLIHQIGEMGGKAIALKANVANPEEVRAMMDRFVGEFGKLDVVVNSAGVSKRCNCIDLELDVWKWIIDVDLTGTFIVTQAALRHMVPADSGRIINIASQRGQVGAARSTAYSAAKGGVIAFTKALAKELGAHGMNTRILANCVAPGPIDAGMNDNLDPAIKADQISGLPLGRFGLAEEVAPAVVFLASDDGNIFTGQVLSPNCGDTMVG